MLWLSLAPDEALQEQARRDKHSAYKDKIKADSATRELAEAQIQVDILRDQYETVVGLLKLEVKELEAELSSIYSTKAGF